MSMVGHIVGLDDRHGQSFTKPECVPFRLAPHMQNALGVAGYEGVFRSVCEITLEILRTNRETLMSVLQPLLYDPLVEAKKVNKNRDCSVKKEFIEQINAIDKLLRG